MVDTGNGATVPKVRDLIAKVNRLAREVRLDAAGEAIVAIPGRVGWSTRSEPKRAKSRAAREIEHERKARRGAILRDWQKRHPEIASAERTLRVERATVNERWDHKREGTAATHEAVRRGRAGAIARLYQSGTLDDDQLAFAQEISAIVELIAADVTVRAASLQSRVDAKRSFDDTFFESLARVQREVAYGVWRAWLGARAAPVLDVIAGDVGLTVAARRHRMHNRKLTVLLIDALNHWPTCLASARREVTAASLAASQAAIL